MQSSAVEAKAGGRHQRKLKNYLLDRHFQLKYAGYLVLIAVVVGGGLGMILWRTSGAVVEQSQRAVSQGEQVVELGREVVAESRKVSAVVQMNIVKDPVYSDNPALAEAFKRDADVQDERLKRQQDALVQQAQALKRQSQLLAERQHTMLLSLCAALVLLVVLIGVAGIFVTHKVAGPIFKMKRQIREVGEGRLVIPGKLRRGDELVDFFETFDSMVRSLRARQEEEIGKLDAAITALEGKTSEQDLVELKDLRHKMRAALEV